MTRQEIKMMMIESMNDALESELEDRKVLDLITEETIHDYLWNKDFGIQVINDFIEYHQDDIIESYLDEIFDDIDFTDLESPW